jgi:positive regulator of sigma E activity
MAEFTEEGIVLSTQDRTATVKITPKGPCPDSHAGCPVKALAEGREFSTEAENLIGAGIGEKVIIKIEIPHFYMGLMLVFVLPLIFIFLGYLIGFFISKLLDKKEEYISYIFMALGFIGSFFVMARCSKSFNPKYKIVGCK